MKSLMPMPINAMKQPLRYISAGFGKGNATRSQDAAATRL
jgi:hypothetical protein